MQWTDEHIDETITGLLNQREQDATICPSEVARALAPDKWRPLMPRVRAVAIQMARRGVLEIRQKGKVVPFDEPLHGPVRLGHKKA